MVKPLVAGNWKMNGTAENLGEIAAIAEAADGHADVVDMMICPPATLLRNASYSASGTALKMGGQDCHPEVSGAHTGDVSAKMLADAGASAVIVGHSERRADHGEGDELVRAKAKAVIAANLLAIVCVGETLEERESGQAVERVTSQLKGSLPEGATASNLVVAYEPVWAIGTGKTPTADDVAAMHLAIREHLSSAFPGEGSQMRILYGGSVKPSNAAELMAVDNVNGALVGGASLTSADFLGIVAAYE
ncbi:triose-phosphate isomerase [Tepidamorphus sp. 3E244]|uniref:triose-phosphate isomerase n=1 Tax=Tepidamorphus sp. 3E244 TaxID=3385498 RepID=UPI0038FCB196